MRWLHRLRALVRNIVRRSDVDRDLTDELTSYASSTHIRNVGLKAQEDQRIWNHARAEGFAIVSKDTDFRERGCVIGTEFSTATGRWRCTDLGGRTVIAIRLDRQDDTSWYHGPPYAVAETVFDEDDFDGCWVDTSTTGGVTLQP